MTDTFGQRSPEPLAHWDPDSLCWRTSQPTLFEDSPEWSGTWPTSGMTHGGQLYALPTPGPPIPAPDCLPLLKTPTAQLAVNGGSQHPDKRKQGGHGPTLADEIEHLLPTPRATDGTKGGTKGGPNQRGSRGDLMLPSVVPHLLPTPAARDWKTGTSNIMDRNSRPLNEVVTELIGGSGSQPSGDGSESSDDPPLFHMT